MNRRIDIRDVSRKFLYVLSSRVSVQRRDPKLTGLLLLLVGPTEEGLLGRERWARRTYDPFLSRTL